MIKLIVISWRTRALVHSGHDNVKHELQKTPTALSQFILVIVLIRIVITFLQRIIKRTESVTD